MNLELSVDGQRVRPDAQGNGQVSFRLRLPAQELRLLSGAARPVDLGVSADRRWLGVWVSGLRFQKGATVVDLPLSAGEFVDGFHFLEKDSCRWTNGSATLPATLCPPWTGEVLLHVSVSDWPGSDMHSAAAETASNLFNAFESLGADCELAFVQRHFRATEPAGLLSWSAIDAARLIAGLDDAFAGVGDPEATRIVWDADEYKISTPYFRTHTGYRKAEPTTATIVHAACARLRLLRRKLMADIAAARRIFVFKYGDGEMPRVEMLALQQALRRIGPASLLCVMRSAPPGAAGTVERVADGLYAGHVSGFVMAQGPYDEWHMICDQTLKLHQARH